MILNIFKPLTWLAANLVVALPMFGGQASYQPKPLQIGMAKSLLTDQPKSFVDVAADDFMDVMKKATALDGEVVIKYAAFEVADKLAKKQLDFGIFQGHEFARVQKKYPDLRPLLIVATKQPMRAYVIVQRNDAAKSSADLRGKSFDLPVGTKETCRVFLEKHCGAKDHKGLAKFFGSLAKSDSPKDALDQLARGKVQATIVDANALEFYKENRGPVFEKNLRVLQQSEEFPEAVIAFKPGTLTQAIVDQFRDGLLKAHTIPEGRELMKSWNVDAFQRVPADYDKRLADVLKAYPPPAAD